MLRKTLPIFANRFVVTPSEISSAPIVCSTVVITINAPKETSPRCVLASMLRDMHVYSSRIPEKRLMMIMMKDSIA